jgi:hypothetical protein
VRCGGQLSHVPELGLLPNSSRLTLGVYTHVASEDDVKIASQLGRILHPFDPTAKGKGLAQIEQALVN